MIEAVIFDLYGTLIQSKIRVDHKEIPRILGLDEKTWEEQVKPGIMKKDFETDKDFSLWAINTFGDGDKGKLNDLLKVYPGFRDNIFVYDDSIPALKFLKEKDIKIGLISNVSPPYKEGFYRFGLDKFFDYVYLSCEQGAVKPERVAYERMLGWLQTEPQDTIMVGDNLKKDVLVPIELGIQGLLIDREDEKDYSPKLRSLLEIKDYL